MIQSEAIANQRERGVSLLEAKANQRERGVTLIEIMVVLAIIAVIVGVLYNRYTHAQAEGTGTAARMGVNQIATALEEYHTDCHDYPGGTTGSAPCTGATGDNNVDVTLFGGASNPYLSYTPLLSNQKYTYTYVAATSSTDASYTICSPYIVDTTTVSDLQTNTGNGSGTTGVGVCFNPTIGMFQT